MAVQELESMAVSVFCENMAMMLAAGIGQEEAAALLCDTGVQSRFHDAARAVRAALEANGGTLAAACAASGFFPARMCKLLAAGESTGRTEQVLRGLARYYAEAARRESQLRSSVTYPAVLLLMMAAILAVLMALVLPTFDRVYASMAGGAAAAGFTYLRIAYVVGAVALCVTAVLAAVPVAALITARTPQGRARLARLCERIPTLEVVARKQALANYAWMLDLYLESGLPSEEALRAAADLTEHRALHSAALACAEAVQEGTPLEQAMLDRHLFEPLYARMLVTGARSGSMAQVMNHLSELFAQDASEEIDRLTGAVEPTLSGLLTLAVGVTLVAAMLPLVGMLGAIG